MVNSNGELLICERLLNPGAWQFPQGGVDDGESPEEAILREIEEEIGLKPEHYAIEKSKSGYRYDYPDEVRSMKPARKAQFIGQEQTYFLCRVSDEAPEVNLVQEHQEFSQARWIHPEDFDLQWLPDFKREVYREVMRDFFSCIII